jgi:hypothetical protein
MPNFTAGTKPYITYSPLDRKEMEELRGDIGSVYSDLVDGDDSFSEDMRSVIMNSLCVIVLVTDNTTNSKRVRQVLNFARKNNIQVLVVSKCSNQNTFLKEQILEKFPRFDLSDSANDGELQKLKSSLRRITRHLPATEGTEVSGPFLSTEPDVSDDRTKEPELSTPEPKAISTPPEEAVTDPSDNSVYPDQTGTAKVNTIDSTRRNWVLFFINVAIFVANCFCLFPDHVEAILAAAAIFAAILVAGFGTDIQTLFAKFWTFIAQLLLMLLLILSLLLCLRSHVCLSPEDCLPTPTPFPTPTDTPIPTPTPTATQTDTPTPTLCIGGQALPGNGQITNLITQQEMAGFAASSYINQLCWSSAGWQWAQANSVTRQAALAGQTGDTPRTRVHWYEGEAYCRWRGGRLPSASHPLPSQINMLLQNGIESEWIYRGNDEEPGPNFPIRFLETGREGEVAWSATSILPSIAFRCVGN